MIGADTITMDVHSGIEALLGALQPFEWIKSATASGEMVELRVDHAQSRVPQVMQEACRINATIRTVSLHEPTLEDVFLKFTGKKMRTAEGSVNPMQSMMHRRR
jgi:ABC-2 type transport system ATP-binding protein